MMTATRRIGDYEIGGWIGQGLVGAIHAGRWLPGGRPVAIEAIPAGLAADAGFTARLATAGRVAAGIASPHLIRTYDLLRGDDGEMFVVSEAPNGPTVASAVARTPLPLAGAVAVARDVLDGLVALHDAGLSHGAVGEATVWISAGGDARLGDIAVATARQAGSVRRDIEAVGRLLRSLTDDTPLPVSVAAAVNRAPGGRDRNQYPGAAEFRDALDDAATGVFGPDWRHSSGLGERARQTPGSLPAIELAAAAGAGRATADADPAATGAALPASTATARSAVTAAVPAAGAVVGHPPPGPRPFDMAAAGRPRPTRRRRLPVVIAVIVLAVLGAGGWLLVTQLPAITNPTPKPLAIGPDLTVTVSPASGGCNSTFGFVATASVTGSGTLSYRWERNTSLPAPLQTVDITSDDASFRLTQAWRLAGTQQFKGTMTFHILSPVDRKVVQSFTYSC